jgi:hypothetical protein
MSAKDHPNNAPGIPMVYPTWFENFQVKYVNRALKPIARFLPGTATIEHRGRTSGTVQNHRHRLPQRQRAGHRAGPRQDRLGEERAGRRPG